MPLSVVVDARLKKEILLCPYSIYFKSAAPLRAILELYIDHLLLDNDFDLILLITQRGENIIAH